MKKNKINQTMENCQARDLREIRDLLKTLRSDLRKMKAIEMLQYEDKNYLAGDNKSRSEAIQELHNHSISLVGKLREWMDFEFGIE